MEELFIFLVIFLVGLAALLASRTFQMSEKGKGTYTVQKAGTYSVEVTVPGSAPSTDGALLRFERGYFQKVGNEVHIYYDSGKLQSPPPHFEYAESVGDLSFTKAGKLKEVIRIKDPQ